MKNENEKKYDIDQVGSMIEALTSTVQLAFDQNDITNRHLNNIEKDVSTLKSDVSELKTDVSELKTDVSTLKSEMVEVKGRLGNVEIKLENVEDKVDVLQEDVTDIKHKLSEKVDREEFNALEKRLIKLERMVLEKA